MGKPKKKVVKKEIPIKKTQYVVTMVIESVDPDKTFEDFENLFLGKSFGNTDIVAINEVSDKECGVDGTGSNSGDDYETVSGDASADSEYTLDDDDDEEEEEEEDNDGEEDDEDEEDEEDDEDDDKEEDK